MNTTQWLGLAKIGMVVLMSAHASASTQDTDRRDIESALQASGLAWSNGDLAGFMKVYENAPATTYIGKAGPLRGYGAIHDMYAARFGGVPGGLGQLTFTLLECRKLGPDFALVTGRFNLQRKPAGSAPATGIFTLVFHKSAAGWGIIRDHTS
jgi:ketosteroid isomerase-like protein